MHIVVGLGNPGRKYEGTRHNVGFEVIAELARRHGAGRPKTKFEAEFVDVHVRGQKLLLVAPQTYMNLSGRAVKQFVEFFDVALDHIIVICDDMNLRLGQLRLRAGGSAGGQNGLKNIIQQLGTQDFPRLRVGVDRPPERVAPTDWVLGKFWKEQQPAVDDAVLRAATGVETWLQDGIQKAMTQVNRDPDHG